MTQANTQPPEWLTQLQEKGFKPYIATSRKLLPYLNTEPFGQKATLYLMEEMDDDSFMEAYFLLEAYLLSNSLGYDSPNFKMPHWVLIDCILMQSAIVGFTISKDSLPEELLDYYRADERIDFEQLNQVPISGQIAASNLGDSSMTGISLFSLGRKWLNGVEGLGLYTKALGFEVYRARDYEHFYGVTQYDNLSLRIHGYYTNEMEISQPIVRLHPCKDMTFIYKMKLDYDPYNPKKIGKDVEPTFWLNAHDKEKKLYMQKSMKEGKRFIVAPPYCVKRDDGIFLPIIEKGPNQ